MTRSGAAGETTRLRRGRLAVAGASLLCTLLVAASALGLLPSPESTEVAVAETTAPGSVETIGVGPTPEAADGGAVNGALLGTAFGQPEAESSSAESSPEPSNVRQSNAAEADAAESRAAQSPALPAGSGHGERVVFDESSQHVWLVGASGAVLRDYPVSGSVVDNLRSGSYQVYSRSRHATSFDLASTMEFMVRFTQGSRAAIGFHSIPVDPQGQRLQTREELGTPQSHGCIRQARGDAVALWRFADVGTPVVVV